MDGCAWDAFWAELWMIAQGVMRAFQTIGKLWTEVRQDQGGASQSGRALPVSERGQGASVLAKAGLPRVAFRFEQ